MLASAVKVHRSTLQRRLDEAVSFIWRKSSCRLIRILYYFLSVDNQIQGWSKIIGAFLFLKHTRCFKILNSQQSDFYISYLLIPNLFYPQVCKLPQYVPKYFWASVTCKYKMFLFTIQFKFCWEIVWGLL